MFIRKIVLNHEEGDYHVFTYTKIPLGFIYV